MTTTLNGTRRMEAKRPNVEVNMDILATPFCPDVLYFFIWSRRRRWSGGLRASAPDTKDVEEGQGVGSDYDRHRCQRDRDVREPVAGTQRSAVLGFAWLLRTAPLLRGVGLS